MNYKEALEEELAPYLKSILARQLLGVIETRIKLNGILRMQKNSQVQ